VLDALLTLFDSLGPLVKNVGEQHVTTIAQTLVGHLLNADKKKDELRDISAIGLKTVFGELNYSDASTKTIVEQMSAQLVAGIASAEEKTPVREQHLLEVLAVLLTRFGSLTTKREALQAALLPLLLSTRQATRRRAIDCLSLLAVHESDEMFNKLVEHLLTTTGKSGGKVEHKRTMIQCFAAISRSVGYKLGPFLNKVVPLVIKFCDTDAADADEDLRENCLQCCETLINRCPKDIAPHLDQIEKVALKYLSFDPNYAGGSDDEKADGDADGDGDGGDAMDEDQLSDEAFSDDDDMSWKVDAVCVCVCVCVCVYR
jgi:cullin-associated NEDD8-dissociated protein 1